MMESKREMREKHTTAKHFLRDTLLTLGAATLVVPFGFTQQGNNPTMAALNTSIPHRTEVVNEAIIKTRLKKKPSWFTHAGFALIEDTKSFPPVDVTVIKPEKKKEDFGVAVLINMVTDKDHHFYQVGYVYNWVYEGFKIAYEDMDRNRNSSGSMTSPQFTDANITEGDKLRFTPYLFEADGKTYLRVEIKNVGTDKLLSVVDFDADGATKFIGSKDKPYLDDGRYSGADVESFHYEVSDNNGGRVVFATANTSDFWLFQDRFPNDASANLPTMSQSKEMYEQYKYFMIRQSVKVSPDTSASLDNSGIKIRYDSKSGEIVADSK
jgi:hypothetical protein